MPLPHFNVEWIRSFIAVVDYEGFTRAATMLHRTQSRVSAHVAALEDEIGARLFDRRASPVMLTAEGQAFLPRARRAVHELEAGAADIAALRGQVAGRLKIGSFPSASAIVLAPLIAQYGALYPAVAIELHEGPARWIEEVFAKNQIELAIRGIEPPPRRSTIKHVSIYSEPVLLIAPPGAIGGASASQLRDRLGSLPLISIGEPVFEEAVGYEYRNTLQTDTDPRIRRMVVSQPATLVALVRAGVGVGLLGQLAADMVGTEGLERTPMREGRDIGLFWNAAETLSPASRRFIDLLHATAPPEELSVIPWDPASLKS